MQGGEWKCIEQLRGWNSCPDVRREAREGVMCGDGDAVVMPAVAQNLWLY